MPSWRAEEKLTPQQALQMYTVVLLTTHSSLFISKEHAAFASKDEYRTGKLARNNTFKI